MRAPYPIDRKGNLDVDRLLAPERAVVVEDGDPLDWWHVVWRPVRRYGLDELENGSLPPPVIPRGQRVEAVFAHQCRFGHRQFTLDEPVV
jgi:hypothetical protein